MIHETDLTSHDLPVHEIANNNLFLFFSPLQNLLINRSVLPTEGPQIYLTRSKNKVGDVVTINCTSSKSKPAANLKWFINDHFIDPEKVCFPSLHFLPSILHLQSVNPSNFLPSVSPSAPPMKWKKLSFPLLLLLLLPLFIISISFPSPHIPSDWLDSPSSWKLFCFFTSSSCFVLIFLISSFPSSALHVLHLLLLLLLLPRRWQNDDDYDLISSTEKDSKGLEVSSLAMKFLVKEKHFVNGIMRMKCTAIVARMYQMSKESIESIEPDDDSSFHPSSSSSGSSSGRDRILKMSENLSQGMPNIKPTGIIQHVSIIPSLPLSIPWLWFPTTNWVEKEVLLMSWVQLITLKERTESRKRHIIHLQLPSLFLPSVLSPLFSSPSYKLNPSAFLLSSLQLIIHSISWITDVFLPHLSLLPLPLFSLFTREIPSVYPLHPRSKLILYTHHHLLLLLSLFSQLEQTDRLEMETVQHLVGEEEEVWVGS